MSLNLSQATASWFDMKSISIAKPTAHDHSRHISRLDTIIRAALFFACCYCGWQVLLLAKNSHLYGREIGFCHILPLTAILPDQVGTMPSSTLIFRTAEGQNPTRPCSSMEGTKTPHSAHGEEIPRVRLGQVWPLEERLVTCHLGTTEARCKHWLGGWKRKHAQNSQEFKQFSELKPVRDY